MTNLGGIENFKTLQSCDFLSLLRSWLEKLKITFSGSFDVSEIKLGFSNTNFLSFLFWMLLALLSFLLLVFQKSAHM